MPRWHVGCDACKAGGWIGPGANGMDAWCEGCQTSAVLAHDEVNARCARCGSALTIGEPRFEELFGDLQNLHAVLAAWDGDPSRLAALLPERPRYLTDLNPPDVRASDAAPVRAALARLHAGAFAEARVALKALLDEPATREDPRLWQALGIAAQRTGDLAFAETAFTRALERAPDQVPALLDRGALRARRGEYAGAREDFARAGEGREARWNRAAAAVLAAVATTPGLPEPLVLEEARAGAGEPNAYWSEHTIGRLLWTALVERARTRMDRDGAVCADERVLRAAESELEFQTFWDRALVVHGYAVLGMEKEAGAAAQALALELVAELGHEPALSGPAGVEMQQALADATTAIRAGTPSRARQAVERLMARDDLRRYRVKCVACGHGMIGVEGVEDEPGASDPEADEVVSDSASGGHAG